MAVALASPSLFRVPRRRDCDRAEAQKTERELLVRYHREGDLAAREELVERFLPLARDLALRYTYTDELFDDLLQVASLGLIKAIDRFEPGRGTKFTSYAAPTILGELKRHFRDKGWALHVPRDLQERTLAVSRETEALSKSLGRSPKVREVADSLGCSVEAVLEAQEASASYEAASLDAPTSREDDEAAALIDMLGDEDSPTSSSRAATRSPAPGRPFRTSSARCSSFASCTTSHSARSGTRSATRRCTCRACCDARSTAWRRRQPPPEQLGVLDGEALPVVVEVDEDLGRPAPLRDPPGPLIDLRVRVVAPSPAPAVVQSHERPVGGQLARLKGPLRVVCDHERCGVAAQKRVDVLV